MPRQESPRWASTRLSSSRGCVLLVLVLLLLVGCLFFGGMMWDVGPFGHDAKYVPNYPRAEQVKVLTGAQIPTPVPLTNPNAHYIGWTTKKMVTFVTNDRPERILAFYREAMQRRFF